MVPLLASVVLVGSDDRQAPLPENGFSIRKPVFKTIRFLVDLPDDYGNNRRERFPLILFLHGSGERGLDLTIVRRHGPPKEIANGRHLPFIVVSPQCDPGRSWDPDVLAMLLDEVEKKYRVDRDREYLTGLSMGGGGTWDLAIQQPHRFAAIAPISGFGDPTAVSVLKDTPAWVTHGDADPSVPIARDSAMVDALRASGGDVRFDIVKGGGHDVWTDVYDKDDLYTWFLSHRLSHQSAPRASN